MKDIKNIHVDSISTIYDKPRAAAGWEDDEARYHVWFNTNTMEIDRDYGRDDPVIYKNPLVSDRNDPAFFDTRKLNATKPTNAEILKHVFEVIERDGLIAKAAIKAEERESQRQAESREAMRQERIKQAGPRLVEALRKMVFLANMEVHGDKTPVQSDAEALLRELGEAE